MKHYYIGGWPALYESASAIAIRKKVLQLLRAIFEVWNISHDNTDYLRDDILTTLIEFHTA